MNELKESIRKLEHLYQVMLVNMNSLEDTILVLSENKERSKKKECKEAKKMAKNIKRKRQCQAKDREGDSDTSRESANRTLL